MKSMTWGVVCLWVATGFVSQAEAQVPDDPVLGLQLSTGGAAFLGDLADDVAPMLDVQLETLFLKSETWPIMAYFAFDVFALDTLHSGNNFPYSEGAGLKIRAFLWIPNLCWQGGERVLLCGGVGQGTVNVNADGEGSRRDFGTWNYQTSLKVFPTKNWSVTLLAKYIGRVEQQVNGEDSYFTILSAGVGTGWTW